MNSRKVLFHFGATAVNHLKLNGVIETVLVGSREQCDKAKCLGFPGLLRRKGGFQILTYHKVSPNRDKFSIDTVTTKEFEEQIKYLSKYYNICSLEYLIEESLNGRINNRALAITFDDGYQDLYHFALPILKKYNTPAIIFLVTGLINRTEILWFERAINIVKYHRESELVIENEGRILKYDTDTIEMKATSTIKILEFLKSLNPDIRNKLLGALEKQFQFKGSTDSGQLMLTWEQIKEMRKYGISFGAHTVNHNILTTLSPTQLEQEIRQSKRDIESQLQEKVMLFAYPNGRSTDFNSGIKLLLKNSGFKCAVTTIAGLNSIATDFFELRRFRPWQNDPKMFALQLISERIKYSIKPDYVPN